MLGNITFSKFYLRATLSAVICKIGLLYISADGIGLRSDFVIMQADLEIHVYVGIYSDTSEYQTSQTGPKSLVCRGVWINMYY